MYRSQLPFVLGAMAVLASAGCEDRPITAPGPEEGPRSAKAGPPPQRQLWTSDDEFARVARAEVPGFAGFYFDDQGTPVILLKDHRQSEAAKLYLAPQLERARTGNAGAPKGPIIRKVAHDFADLKGWFDKARVLLPREDVHMLDINEAENRVFIGVRDEAAIRAVRREAARLGVPPGILNVEVRQRPALRATLQDWTSLLAGGYKIASAGGDCTLGFNAVYQGTWIFVTNSHCTWNIFAYDGSIFTQPTYHAGYEIGTEVRDVPLFYCETPTEACRWSDAAYVQHNGNRGVGQGKIAYTAVGTGGPAPSLNVLGHYDVINRYAGTIAEGTPLYKTGQASGTTFGRITMACVLLDGETQDGRYYDLLCQDVSNVWSQHGDSGSPMYYSLGNGQVMLYGILWGGPPYDYGTTWSSRLSNIENDLGPLTALCAPGYGC